MLCTMARDASGHAVVKTAEVADLAPDVSVVLLILFHLCMHNFSVRSFMQGLCHCQSMSWQ